MKYISAILAMLTVLICLLSCSSTYYYSTLSSNDEGISRDNAGSFIFDTDTIQIAYSFKGQDGPIQISVLNKLDKPMYIDWSRSAIIINDVSTTYLGEKYHLSGQSSYNTTKITSSGYEYDPAYVSFIPPMRKIEHHSLWLSNLNFSHIDKKEYNSSTLRNASNQDIKVMQLDFSERNTPLFFESYLTVVLDDGAAYAITQSFYISRLIRTNIKPSELSNELAQRKDLMYTFIKANNTGWEVFAIGGIIVGATILDATLNTYY